MTHAFLLTCRLVDGGYAALQGALRFPPPITANPLNRDSNGVWTLTVRAGGFTSEEEARATGVAAANTLTLAGVVLGVGIDVGSDVVTGHPPRRTLGSAAGLRVFAEHSAGARSLDFAVGRPFRKLSNQVFEAALADAQAVSKAVSRKQMLAAVLYNQSHFHTSESARFLTLMSAVEALSERRPRSAKVLSMVDVATRLAESPELGAQEREDFINGLRGLRQESISAACRRLVSTHCNSAAVKQFARAYLIRSKLLHEGTPPEGAYLALEAGQLDPIVQCVIAHHIATS